MLTLAFFSECPVRAPGGSALPPPFLSLALSFHLISENSFVGFAKKRTIGEKAVLFPWRRHARQRCRTPATFPRAPRRGRLCGADRAPWSTRPGRLHPCLAGSSGSRGRLSGDFPGPRSKRREHSPSRGPVELAVWGCLPGRRPAEKIQFAYPGDAARRPAGHSSEQGGSRGKS